VVAQIVVNPTTIRPGPRILCQERFNTDGYQFHQYQQSLLFVTDHTEHKKTIYDVGNPGPGLGQEHKCKVVQPGNGIPTRIHL